MFNHHSPFIPPDVPTQATLWARQAGQIARRHFRNASFDVKAVKADKSLLTQADLEIEQFLVAQIRAAYPNHALLGEEGTQTDIQSPYIWAIDPIDGTTAFVQGLPGWGISIGLLYEFEPIFGLFYMPLLDDLTYTTSTGMLCSSTPLHPLIKHSRGKVMSDWRRQGFLAVNAEAHHDFEIAVQRTKALGSVVASLVYTARGSATAAFIPKAYLWDLVAGACILKQAGGELRYLSGQPIDYSSLADGSFILEPIIAGHPRLLTELQNSIVPRPPP